MSKGTELTAAERLRIAMDLFEAGVRMMRQNLRRADASATEEEIDARLRAWLRDRPGAALGDSSGKRREWPIEHR